MSFPRYPAYRESGVAWLRELPEHWSVTSVSRLFEIKAGGDLKVGLFSEFQTEEHPYPIYTNAKSESAVYGYTKKAIFPGNTITVTGRGDVGFAVYRDHPFDAIIRLLVLKPYGSMEAKFYSYLINSLLSFTEGSSAVSQLSTDQISPYKVSVPPLIEQQEIVGFLDYETARIDALVQEQQRLIEMLKEKRQAVISHSVTKGLDLTVPMKDSGVQWLGEVPAHWEVLRMRFLCRITTGDKDTQDAQLEGEYPFFVRSETIERSNTYSFDGEGVFTSGDGAGVGKIFHHFEGKCAIHQRVYLFHSFSGVLGHFFYNFIKTKLEPVVLAQSAKSTVDSLRLPMLQNFWMTRPPKIEQEAICDYVSKFESETSKLLAETKIAISLLNERRSALISAAVTGKIDVRGWKPSADKTFFDNELRQAVVEARA